mmetsp:Transcript_122568/g.343028  ORF Transcript_122568/g.343028 Transcript_122568/m.343028 type:complete len:510 (-) Transcript_122568:24-1553(-)
MKRRRALSQRRPGGMRCKDSPRPRRKAKTKGGRKRNMLRHSKRLCRARMRPHSLYSRACTAGTTEMKALLHRATSNSQRGCHDEERKRNRRDDALRQRRRRPRRLHVLLHVPRLLADAPRRAAEAVGVHEPGPHGREVVEEAAVVHGVVLNNGRHLRIHPHQHVQLQHVQVLALGLVLRLARARHLVLLPLLQGQSLEVAVVELGRVRRPSTLIAAPRRVHLAERVAAADEHDGLPGAKPQDAHRVLQDVGVCDICGDPLVQELGAGTVQGVGAAAAELHGPAARVLDGGIAREDDEVGPREALAELVLDGLQHLQGLVEVGVRRPVLLRGEAEPGAVAAAEPIGLAEGRGAPRGEAHEEGAVVRLAVVQVGGQDILRCPENLRDLVLDLAEVGEVLGGRRERVLEGLRGRHVLADATRHGAHVAGHQLVPRVREGVVEGRRVLRPSLHDLLVLRVVRQRDITRQHADLGLVTLRVLDAPLPMASGPLELLPLVVRQGAPVVVVPLRGV